MPLLTAQKHGLGTQPVYNFYHFPEEHKANWEEFWKSNDGDLDKILEFAKKADIANPNEWVESLHIFLFDTFCGNPKLLKKASKTAFGPFLQKIVENHKKEPKDKGWYTKRGVTKDSFIGIVERAAEIKDIQHCVSFINARISDLGFYLYSEYILSKTSEKSKIKSVASNLMKRSKEIIENVTGRSIRDEVTSGSIVAHCMFPGEHFSVIGSGTFDEDPFIAVVDENSHVGFVFDYWNLDHA